MPKWLPLPGPQTAAYYCPADILYYGGSAGGGKSDLLLGLALNEHRRSIIYRREATQLVGLIDRLADILGHRDGLNSQSKIWRLEERQIEFGSCNIIGNEVSYQGRPHSLKGFDEIPHFAESQFRFLQGWMRSVDKNERKRVVCAGNPPTKSEERWVVNYWGPWIDPMHELYPTPPGQLLFYTTIDGKDTIVGPEPVEVDGELITPLSRTFIPSSVTDNPYLMESGYMATLQALPEPLRSQMLYGDFGAGVEDDPHQVVPTAWVDAAMDRWVPKDPKGTMDSMGVDPARGGSDEEIHSRRHGVWFDELLCFPGAETPDGPATASRVLLHRRDGAPVHVDVIGVGSSAYDFLKTNGVQTVPVNFAEKSTVRDKTNSFAFSNARAEYWWRFREALDPQYDMGIALPKDNKLRADLCAPKWSLTARGIQIESKDEIKKRIGRSPDRGDAVVMAYRSTVKESFAGWRGRRPRTAKINCNP